MRFRPCIDIHNGKIKQIVGGSLLDQGDFATENFVSEKDGTFYGKLYKENHLNGGHIIMLNARDSKYYEEDKVQALKALKAFEGGLQIGGGITDENAKEFIESGASHVIVTSFVFAGGKVHYDRLDALKEQVGREHLVLDLSCRKRDDKYYITTDRWQKFTEEELTIELLHKLRGNGDYCVYREKHAFKFYREIERGFNPERVTGTTILVLPEGTFERLKNPRRLFFF